LAIALSAALAIAGYALTAGAQTEAANSPAPATGPAPGKGMLTVYTLDIGQGDSTLITTPSGKNILIDGGMGGPGYKKKDKGKTVILPFLKEKGIKTLDYVIMTHPDFDHIGGLIYLLNNTKEGSEYPLTIKEFLDPGYPGTTYLYQDLLKAVKERPEIKYRNPKPGDTLDFGEGVTAEVLAPLRIFTRVDFPAPFLPSRARTSPACRAKSTPSSARTCTSSVKP
jgi:beta-lactamase superfamily II metal-dependent hydrolase